MAFKPMGDQVFVKVLSSGQEKTSGGIIMAEGSITHQVAEVIAVGYGLYTQTGDKIPMIVKVGDKVLIHPNTGKDLKLDGEDYKQFRESDFIGHEPK